MNYLGYCNTEIWVFSAFTLFIIYDIAKTIWLKGNLNSLHQQLAYLNDEIAQMREEMSFDLLDMGVEIIDSEEDDSSDEDFIPSEEQEQDHDQGET